MRSNTHTCTKLLTTFAVPGMPIEGLKWRDIELLTFHNITSGTQPLCSISSALQSWVTCSAERRRTVVAVRCAEDGS